MSLRLRQAIAGRPNLESKQSIDVLTVGGQGYIVDLFSQIARVRGGLISL